MDERNHSPETYLDVLHADTDADQTLILGRIVLAPTLHQALHATQARRRDKVANSMWESYRVLLVRQLLWR
jgi:hypothetical protein